MSGDTEGGPSLQRRPPRRGMWWLVPAVTGPEPLSRVVARLGDCDGEADSSAAGWAADVAMAEAWGLLTAAGAEDDPILSRTEFGDAWAAQRDRSGWPFLKDKTWPPGPGRFGLLFYPLTRRPTFSVLALTGPAVSEIRQGGWNLEHGFSYRGPNPVTDVEMRSVLLDGVEVSVQSAIPERSGFPALRVSDYSLYTAAAELLMTALKDRADPWQARVIEVDGMPAEAFVLNLESDGLPPGVVGPAFLAVSRIGATEVTVVAESRVVDPTFTEISTQDLLGIPLRPEVGA